jgi:mono/diheme cytochrome c family protein
MVSVRPPWPRWLIAALVVGAIDLPAAPDGAGLYEEHCLPCHGPDGRAHTPAARKLRAKDLTASRLPDADIAHQIAGGKKDPAGKERMPAFQAKLAEADIAALVEFVKRLRK